MNPKFFQPILWLNLLAALSTLAATTAAPPVAETVAAVQECRLFGPPLVWVGEQAPTEAESVRLLAALSGATANDPSPAFPALERFVQENPTSPWAPSVHLRLAAHYDGRGGYSLALQHYRKAWEAAGSFTAGDGKVLGDTALTRWTEAALRLGNLGELELAVKAGAGRKMSDLTQQALLHRGQAVQKHRSTLPATGFRCGTVSLLQLARARGWAKPTSLLDFPSPKGGFNLFTLKGLAQEVSLEMVAVRRPTGDTNLPAPSLIHFAVNHYAAILEVQGVRAKVFDTAAGGVVWRDRATLNHEASGAFLVLAQIKPPAWPELTTAEASAIVGGGPSDHIVPPTIVCDEEGAGSCPTCSPPGATITPPPWIRPPGGGWIGWPGSDGTSYPPMKASCSSCGTGSAGLTPLAMPTWEISEPNIAIWLRDKPLAYRTSQGAEVALKMYYHQQDGFWQVPPPNVFSFGTNWGSNWRAYLDLTNRQPSDPTWSNTVGLLIGPGASVRYYDTTNAMPSYGRNTFLQPVVVAGALVAFREVFASGATTYYELLLPPEGSSTVRRAFLTRRVDPRTNATSFHYSTNDGLVLLRTVVDSDGRTNTLTYDATVPTYVSAIQSPLATNAVRFTYNANGMLQTLVDIAGLSSSFEYDSTNVWSLTALVTPYGRTTFADAAPLSQLPATLGEYYDPNRAITVTEPTGAKHFLVYWDNVFRYNDLFPPNNFYGQLPNVGDTSYEGLCDINMVYRNTFYWGPRQYPFLTTTNPLALTAHDLRVARCRNWLHPSDLGGGRDRGGSACPASAVSDTLNMECEPSPNPEAATPDFGQRTWYGYSGKRINYYPGPHYEGTNRQPSYIARRLPNGDTHYIHRTYNALGKVLTETNTYSASGGVTTRGEVFTYDPSGTDLLSVTNAAGVRTAAYAYNSLHQVIAETNALDEVTLYFYDATGRLTGKTTPAGLTTTNFYDANGWLTATIDIEIGRSNVFTWTNGLIFTKTDERGLTLTNSYDLLGRLTNVAYPDHTALRYVYDKLDIVQQFDRLGFSNSFTYDAGRRMTSATDARGHSTWYTYCTCGSLESITDSLSNVTTFTYDVQGHPTGVNYPGGASVVRHYNLLGQVTNEVDISGQSVTNYYNNQGLLVAASNQLGCASFLTYDLEDRVLSSTGANGITITNAYDVLGRLQARGYPDGGLETFGYSAGGLVVHTDQIGACTDYVLDPAGRKLAETNANHEVTQFTYNPGGDLLALTDGKNQVTTWEYDLYGRATRKLDNASAEMFRYGYDASGHLTNRWTPAKGTTGYAYDPAGNLTSVDYSASPDLSLAYDALNRLTNLVDAVGSTAYTYNANGLPAAEDGPWDSDIVSYAYDSHRHRTGLSLAQPAAGDWTLSYGYDAAGRLDHIVSPAGAFTNRYGSSLVSLPVSLTLPGGSFITNRYDAQGRMLATRLANADDTTLDSQAYGYNTAGQRLAVTNTYGNYHLYTYDNTGQLKTALGAEAGGTARAQEQFRYDYDAAGNVASVTNGDAVKQLTVNGLNQIDSVVNGSGTPVAGAIWGSPTSVTVNGSTAFLYADCTFVRTNVTLTNGANSFTAVSFDSQGRADTNTVTAWHTNQFAPGYDANGNLTNYGWGGRTLAYDDENQLTSVQVAGAWKSDFAYDGKMRRRLRTEATWQAGGWVTNLLVRYVYDGNLVVQERHYAPGFSTVTPVQLVTYTRGRDLSGTLEGAGGIGGLLARSVLAPAAGATSHAYYHADANGNVTALANTNGALVGRYWYDPFGNTLGVAGAAAQANLYRFSSKELHEKSGLVYCLYRYYEQSLQRWITRDPLAEVGFETARSWAARRVPHVGDPNAYRFVFNSPLDTLDPEGLDCRSGCRGKYYHNLMVCAGGAGLALGAAAIPCVIACAATGPGYAFCIGFCVGFFGGPAFDGFLACGIGAGGLYVGCLFKCDCGLRI